MSGSQINYRENYFQHPSLTKICGDPTYESLAKLEKECKANGKSVRTTLGGGLQGHLGLVSSTIAYQRVSPGVPFVRPILPILPDLTNATAAQIADARQLHHDDMETFKACNLIERTIIQQINTAIDEACLADLIDDETGLLEGTIPEIMKELFDTYGAITPQSLTAAKAKLEATSYIHSKPIVNIFTAINDYANMADAANAAETTTQLINIGLIIITRSTIFASDIRKWNDKPDANKTWPSFKDHFKAAQKAIKKSQPVVTTDTLGFHDEANAASHHVNPQDIDKSTTSTRETDSTMTPDTAADLLAEQQMLQQLSHMANSTQQNQNMMNQMQSLMSTISTLQTQVNSQTRGQDDKRKDRRPGRDRRGGRGTGNHTRTKQPPKYCWTHGNCAHTGSACETKAAGHIDCATYANMQGGSTHNCHWL